MTASTATTLSAHEWAVEVDTVLAQLWGAQQTARDRIRSAYEGVHYALGERATYRSKYNKDWPTTGPEAADLLRAKVHADVFHATPWKRTEAERVLARIEEVKDELVRLRDAAEEFETEWDELRWTRFYLVTNNGGHIHRTMACSTCYPTTQFAWLPTLSGLTEADAVAAHGTILCSICFPSAPVEWTVGKVVDTSNDCPISGQTVTQVYGSWDEAKTHFRHSGRGGYIVGACPGECGQRGVAVTSNYKIRKHKRKDA